VNFSSTERKKNNPHTIKTYCKNILYIQFKVVDDLYTIKLHVITCNKIK